MLGNLNYRILKETDIGGPVAILRRRKTEKHNARSGDDIDIGCCEAQSPVGDTLLQQLLEPVFANWCFTT
jgi:hypothetical protein